MLSHYGRRKSSSSYPKLAESTSSVKGETPGTCNLNSSSIAHPTVYYLAPAALDLVHETPLSMLMKENGSQRKSYRKLELRLKKIVNTTMEHSEDGSKISLAFMHR